MAFLPRSLGRGDFRISKLELMTAFYSDEYRKSASALQDGINGWVDHAYRSCLAKNQVSLRLASYRKPFSAPVSTYLTYAVHENQTNFKSVKKGEFFVVLGRHY